MSDAAHALKIGKVAKGYSRATRVLSDVTLEAAPGGVTGLVGPSGSGKTTLLRLIAGLEKMDCGTVTLDDNDITALPAHERDIAMAFQGAPLYPHLTVGQNIAFPLRMKGAARKIIRRRIEELDPWLRLESLLKRRPHGLSGGERQRVALAKALVCRPRLYLFDEPLSHVDPQHRSTIRTHLKRYLRELGITTLYVTHDQGEAMALCDRICVLLQGRVQQIGTPVEIYRRPVNRFVARFFGAPSMNLFEGQVKPNGARMQFVLASGDCLTLPEGYEGLQGKSITLGQRPEHLSFAAGRPGDLTATIGAIEPQGALTQFHAASARGATFVIAATAGEQYRVGDEIAIEIDWGRVHVFE